MGYCCLRIGKPPDAPPNTQDTDVLEIPATQAYGGIWFRLRKH